MGMYADVCGTEIKIDNHLAECIRTVRGLEPTAYLSDDGMLDLERPEVVRVVSIMAPHHHAIGLLRKWLATTVEDSLFFA